MPLQHRPFDQLLLYSRRTCTQINQQAAVQASVRWHSTSHNNYLYSNFINFIIQFEMVIHSLSQQCFFLYKKNRSSETETYSYVWAARRPQPTARPPGSIPAASSRHLRGCLPGQRMGQIWPASHSPKISKTPRPSPDRPRPIHSHPPPKFSRSASRENAERARALGTRRPPDSNAKPQKFPCVARLKTH